MATIVQNAGKFFFPHRKKLKLFQENYSPDLLEKITYAGAHSSSSFDASQDNLKKLAEIDISASHIQRLTIRIASEFDKLDSQRVDNWFENLPTSNNYQMEVVSISVDGGRVQRREENCGAGVHNPRWIETKVGCLQVLQSEGKDTDPHPQLPKIFQDQKSVKNMIDGLKGRNKPKETNDDKKSNSDIIKFIPEYKGTKTDKDTSYAPKVLEKYVIADIVESEIFGHSIYHKSHLLQFHTAHRKAFLGDGDPKIWNIYNENFKAEEWIGILDFIHATEYAFNAAKLSTDSDKQAWSKYIEFVSHIWQGRPLTVIRRLNTIINKLDNKKRKSKFLQDKIEGITKIRNYFKNNINRMNYAEYRKQGLPISSCHVESTIKQFNLRIKSSEKFWNDSSARGIIKMKASLLSNDNSFNSFWKNRHDYQSITKRNYGRNNKNQKLKIAA